MTNECDDQMMLDLEPDYFHQPVTEENVTRALTILFVPPVYDAAYEACVSFLKPLPWECEIIERVVRKWCKK